ncbi:hypothetical protein AAEX28_10915 [Lentisphaerota bacterium WC36G]|nr:hypothetical protein LJT99_13755 [Lentisphaerae bacterium WC36]
MGQDYKRIFLSQLYTDELRDEVIDSIINDLSNQNENIKILQPDENTIHISQNFDKQRIFARNKLLGYTGDSCEIILKPDIEKNLMLKYSFLENQKRFAFVAKMQLIPFIIGVSSSFFDDYFKFILIGTAVIFLCLFFFLFPNSKIGKLLNRCTKKFL